MSSSISSRSLVLVALVACSKATPNAAPVASTSASIAPAPAASSAPPAAVASVDTVTSAVASAPAAAPGAPKALDTSDWKDAPAGSTLEMRWTVDQTNAKPPVGKGADDDLTKHTVPLELLLTLNGRPHTIALRTNAAPPYVSACGGVSFFYAGMNVAFQVKRERRRAVLTRTETSESKPGVLRQQLYAFDVPSGVKLTQEVVTLDPGGDRTTKSCSSPSLP